MKKSIVIFLGIIVVIGLIIFFKPKVDLPSSGSSNTTTLSFWTFQELHKAFMDDAVETWNKANPNNQIELKTDVYPYEEMHNKLLISLQSGVGAPDLADIEISKFAN